MAIRLGLLMGVLAAGLMALPSDGRGFDGGRAAIPCAEAGTVHGSASCRIAPAPSAETTAVTAAAMVPLPLPRPPELGLPARQFPACSCDHPDDRP